MLKYEDIIDAPLGKLKEAVDDWSEMVTKLQCLTEVANSGIIATVAPRPRAGR
ncbi:hypothetical protein [Streptomyces griseus]|uniref:hypothetical protein n=1 Tax=Streptomyces griseus TaxID=1911 RepID=UPI0033FBC958